MKEPPPTHSRPSTSSRRARRSPMAGLSSPSCSRSRRKARTMRRSGSPQPLALLIALHNWPLVRQLATALSVSDYGFFLDGLGLVGWRGIKAARVEERKLGKTTLPELVLEVDAEALKSVMTASARGGLAPPAISPLARCGRPPLARRSSAARRRSACLACRHHAAARGQVVRQADYHTSCAIGPGCPTYKLGHDRHLLDSTIIAPYTIPCHARTCSGHPGQQANA